MVVAAHASAYAALEEKGGPAFEHSLGSIIAKAQQISNNSPDLPPLPTVAIALTLLNTGLGFITHFVLLTVGYELADFTSLTELVMSTPYNFTPAVPALIVPFLGDTVPLAAVAILSYAVVVISIGTGVCAIMHNSCIRGLVHLNLVNDLFAYAASGSGMHYGMARFALLSAMHLISMSSMLISILYLLIVLVYAVLVWHITSLAAGLVWCALFMVVSNITIRAYVAHDLFFLYSAVSDANLQVHMSNIPAGAVRCVVGFGVGMLLLDAPLFMAGGAFKIGDERTFGLPAALEDPIFPLLDRGFGYAKLFFVPICFLGLGAIVGTIQRGAWLMGPDAACCKCGVRTKYADDARAAKSTPPQWKAFKASRFRRRVLIEALSFGVLLGVIVLIPIYVLLFAGTSAAAGTCQALEAVGYAATALPTIRPALPANFATLAAEAEPLLNFTKVLAAGVLDKTRGNFSERTADTVVLDDFSEVSILSAEMRHELNMQPFCSGAQALFAGSEPAAPWEFPFNCTALVPPVALFLSANPYFNAAPLSAFETALEPLCPALRDYFGALDTFCKSGGSFNRAPRRVLDVIVDRFVAMYKHADEAAGFIFDDEDSTILQRSIGGLNVTQLKTVASLLDAIDYQFAYPVVCEDWTRWYGFNFWFFVMLCGVLLHLPAAMAGWHLLNRYSILMLRADVKAEGGMARFELL